MKVVKTNKLLRNFKATIEEAAGEPILVMRPDKNDNLILLPKKKYDLMLQQTEMAKQNNLLYHEE